MSDEEIWANIEKSSKAFLTIVWPAFSEYFGAVSIVPVEAVTRADFHNKLDLIAGIDAWLIQSDEMGMFGLATRVQNETNWRTFSIRETGPGGRVTMTEAQKREYAVRNRDRGILMPQYTLQAYVDGERLLGAAVVRTDDLFWHLIKSRDDVGIELNVYNRDGICRRKNGADQRYFIAVKWDGLRDSRFVDTHVEEVRGTSTLLDAQLSMTLDMRRNQWAP